MAAGYETTTSRVSQIPLIPFGLSVSAFFVISYVLCILSGLIVPGWSMHQPWLQFFPGFEWLTVKGFIIGLLEAIVYGWYVAFLFGWLFNFFAARG